MTCGRCGRVGKKGFGIYHGDPKLEPCNEYGLTVRCENLSACRKRIARREPSGSQTP